MNNKENNKKRAYTSPEIKVYPIQEVLFICASITPNANTSGTTSWDAEQEHNGGGVVIGDGSSIAPAKTWGNLWEDDTE